MSICVSWPARVAASDDSMRAAVALLVLTACSSPPLRRLVRAPRRRDRRDGKQDRGEQLDPVLPPLVGLHAQAKTLTARAITSPTTVSEMSDCSAIVSFAHQAMGITSVGLKAVDVVRPRMR